MKILTILSTGGQFQMELADDEMAEKLVKKLLESKDEVVDLTEFVKPNTPLKNVLVNRQNVSFYIIDEKSEITVSKKQIIAPNKLD